LENKVGLEKMSNLALQAARWRLAESIKVKLG
jgi:hypothetical protein